MNPAKNALERPCQQFLQLRQIGAAKAVYVSDQLNLVFHFFMQKIGPTLNARKQRGFHSRR